MAEANRPSLQQVVGENLRRLRKEHQQSQDEMAKTVRLAGPEWTRATVAAIETGKRAVSLEELLLLSLAFHKPLIYFVQGEGWANLGENASATRGVVQHMLQGGAQRWGSEDWEVPATADFPKLGEILRQYATYWPDATAGDLFTAALAATGSAEKNAAAKLGVNSVVIAMTASGLWGHSLTEQRDRLIEKLAPKDASRRSVQAIRGHVTRTLLRELEEPVRKVAKRVKPKDREALLSSVERITG